MVVHLTTGLLMLSLKFKFQKFVGKINHDNIIKKIFFIPLLFHLHQYYVFQVVLAINEYFLWVVQLIWSIHQKFLEHEVYMFPWCQIRQVPGCPTKYMDCLQHLAPDMI